MSSTNTPPHSWDQLFPRPWPAVWFAIYLAILILGFTAPNNDILTFIKLGGIILCLFYVLQYFKSDHLLQLAMLVTCIADIILALNNTAIPGVICFFCVQIIHLFRLSQPTRYYKICLFIVIAFTIISLNHTFELLPTMYVICAFYLVAICTNIFLSWRWFQTAPKAPRAFLALLGFILFLCCDACTAISYLSFTQVFPALLYAPANFFAWIFYYPSQILVSNSTKYDKIDTKGR